MARRLIAPLLFGLIGAGILTGLGLWQVQRLVWKESVLAAMDARLGATPVALPPTPDEGRDEYLAVTVEGSLLPGEIHVLTSRRGFGAGYRVIAPFDTGAGVVLVDRGFVRQRDKAVPRGLFAGRVTGNLLWPDEVDRRFTPSPDADAAIWFARDLPAMAAQLGSAPVLIVLRAPASGQNAPVVWPVSSAAIANDHLQYAITWFSLALVWLGMTAYLVWRITRKSDENA